MVRVRTRLVGGLILVGLVCALLVGVARADWDPRLPGGSAGFDTKNARYFDLPEGRAQIGVSRVDSRYLTVRWRPSDGRSWTQPETVFDAGDDLQFHYMKIRVAGPTLALYATFMPHPEDVEGFDDGYPPGVVGSTVYVVCRDGECNTSRLYDGHPGRAPQITPDGDQVFLAQHGDVYVTWDGGDIEEQRPSGLPEGDYGKEQPLLTPDGSLRAVQGVASQDGCRFTLLTTEPGATSFSPAVTHQDSGDTRPTCTSTVQSWASDYVVVVGRSKYRPWFAEASDSGWRTVDTDPSGQVRYPRTSRSSIAGRFTLSGYWHWRLVLGSSPDGRSLVVQVHRPGDERWGPPQVVARAPAGAECTEIAPKPTYTSDEEDPFYISLVCRSRPAPGAEWVYSYPTAVTDDGTTWQSFVATDMGLRVGDDLLFRGNPAYQWSPEDGLQRLDLPEPPGSVVSLLSDGSRALSVLVRSASGCEVQVQLAAPDASTWSRPVPSTATPLPLDMCELFSVQPEGRNLYHYFGRLSQGMRMVRLTWRGGDGPRLEDGPSVPSVP
jgi:hypothetical protein